MQRHTWFVMQEKCWSSHQTQRGQPNYLARNETSQDSGVKGAHRFAENRQKAPRRSHIDSVKAWEVSSLGRHNARHICSISSTNNGLESWISCRIVSHAEDPKVCQHRADSYLNTGRHRDVWCIMHSSKRTTHRTRKKNLREHRRSERNYLPLPIVSVAIQRGNMLCFTGSFVTNDV